LTSKDGRYIYRETGTDGEGFMKYAVEMGPDATIYIPSFITIGSGIQILIGAG
jgi:hypothetical protein